MTENIVHSFEAPRRGKPDEFDASIAHLLGAYFLEQDNHARFDLRVTGGYSVEEHKPHVHISGEISEHLVHLPHLIHDLHALVVSRYNVIHRTALSSSDILITTEFKPQATELAINNAAGDSGHPIAVAYHKGPLYLPWERYLAVGIRDLIDRIYLDEEIPHGLAGYVGISQLPGLRADGKINVDAIYDGIRFLGLRNITIAAEHETSLPVRQLRISLEQLVHGYLQKLSEHYSVDFGHPLIDSNSLGDWNEGGWKVDEGTREAKPYRDAFASYGVVDDSFSGEDPTKPSSTGTFLARFIAVQIVGNGLADFARVALTYRIGREDVGLNITTQNTGKVSQEKLEAWVRNNIPLGIRDTISRFGLIDPALFKQIVESSDFFQNEHFPWNNVQIRYK